MSTTERGITRRQSEILEFIVNFTVGNGFPPTIREIGTKFGIKSPNGVICHLRSLVRKGYLIGADNISRGYRLVIQPGQPCLCCGHVATT